MNATQQKRELALAGLAGDVKTATALLSENREPAQAWEPLMHVCFEGRHAIVKLLLESGADANPDRKDCRGLLPADIARLHRKRWL